MKKRIKKLIREKQTEISINRLSYLLTYLTQIESSLAPLAKKADRWWHFYCLIQWKQIQRYAPWSWYTIIMFLLFDRSKKKPYIYIHTDRSPNIIVKVKEYCFPLILWSYYSNTLFKLTIGLRWIFHYFTICVTRRWMMVKEKRTVTLILLNFRWTSWLDFTNCTRDKFSRYISKIRHIIALSHILHALIYFRVYIKLKFLRSRIMSCLINY